MRRLGSALAALLLVTVVGTASLAKGLRDFLEGRETIESADGALLNDFAKYYQMHANVRLGGERRLANGVAWRLATDVRTRAIVPRITWMPDRQALLKANALFEAIQGAELVDYERRDIQRRHTELYDWEDGHPPPGVIKPPYVVQEQVAVTYATSRLVSYVDQAREVWAASMGLEIRGRVLDLEQGRIRGVEPCGRSDGITRNFRFGELLDLCQDEAYARFIALWAGKVRDAIAAARTRGDELSAQCGESMEPVDAKEGRRLALYLTSAGVAVFNVYWWRPNSAKYCAFHDNITVNPIIIPYRELEPFMKPGPWRDDVLNQGRASPR
jgi:hypothetical protein